MNGREKTQLQIERGTRGVVEAVDGLRLSLGFDQVRVLTPIVETRLRSGLLASRQMKVAVRSSLGPLLVTIPTGFPKVPCAVEIDLTGTASATAAEEGAVRSLQERLAAMASETTTDAATDSEHFLSPREIVSRAEKTLGGEITKHCDGTGTHADRHTAGSRLVAAVEDDDRDIGDAAITFFCCRRCRSLLFDSTQLHEHHGSQRGEYVSQAKCTSLFLEEPPRFLALDGSVQEGKLLCPKCASRVGNWSWIGSKCSCGEWIVPSYQFTKSKLDERKE